MKKYHIRDIFVALRLAFKNFFYSFICLGVVLFVLHMYFTPTVIGPDGQRMPGDLPADIANIMEMVAMVVAGFIVIQSLLIYFINSRYVVDFESRTVQFPRTDIENSIFAILIAMPYWNLIRKQTIAFDELEQVYIDTDRSASKKKKTKKTNPLKIIFTLIINSLFYPWARKRVNTKYNLNVLGTFGSANLQFSSRQKRDEVRNALNQAIKDSGNNQAQQNAEID